jgi:hypothetical protein
MHQYCALWPLSPLNAAADQKAMPPPVTIGWRAAAAAADGQTA